MQNSISEPKNQRSISAQGCINAVRQAQRSDERELDPTNTLATTDQNWLTSQADFWDYQGGDGIDTAVTFERLSGSITDTVIPRLHSTPLHSPIVITDLLFVFINCVIIPEIQHLNYVTSLRQKIGILFSSRNYDFTLEILCVLSSYHIHR